MPGPPATGVACPEQPLRAPVPSLRRGVRLESVVVFVRQYTVSLVHRQELSPIFQGACAGRRMYFCPGR